MKKILLLIFTIAFFGVNAQVTINPKIKKKSTNDVIITRVEIKDQQTIVSLQFTAKTKQEALKELLQERPDLKEELQQMEPFSRQLALSQLMRQIGNATISFQTGSFLKTTDGKKFKFLKVTGVPASPDRIDAEPGKKYPFKVYFEKLPPGYQQIDLIEFKSDKVDQMTYWNFIGISINNPPLNNQKEPEVKPEESEEEPEEVEKTADYFTEFKLFGKVIDSETNKTIPAKIICKNTLTNEVIDSVITSKSGYYEFILEDKPYEFSIASDGFEGINEEFKPGVFMKKGKFERDIFLEKKRKQTEVEPIEKPVEVEEKPIGEKTNVSSTFKLDKVYFNLGDSKVLPESYEQLDALAKHLIDNPELKIQVEGHTDNQGDKDENWKLSIDRAFNVREYLVSKGVAGNRIKFRGFGDTKPVSSNNLEENRKLNRRVEYKILDN
jgi:outer membrane protein OmpA-like peptidoglycan-associated protein